jgi:hypothetical protein
MKIKTAAVMLDESVDFYLTNNNDLIKRDLIISAMESYSEQNCDIIHDLFNNPCEELKPLEDLWRKENSPHKFVIPDRTAFYKWIRLKILPE